MAIVSSSKKTKFTKCRQARPTGFGVLRRPPPYRCYPVDGLRLGLRVLIRLIFICWHRCPVRPAARPRLSVTVGLGLSDHRVPESDSGSARSHTAAAMTVPQCGMGRGLTTDEWAGTDTLSELEAWLAQSAAFHWHKSPSRWRSYASRGRRRGADSDRWPGPLRSCCGGLLRCQCRRTWTWRCTTSTLRLQATDWHRDCRPASWVPLTGSLPVSGSRLRPLQMLKRNFKLNLKYDPVVTVPSSAVTLA